MGELLTQVDQKNHFDRIVTLLEGSISERDEQRNRAAKSMLRLGAFLGYLINRDKKILLQKQKISKLLPNRSGRLKESQGNLDDNVAYFKDVVITVAQEYSSDIIDAQFSTLTTELQQRQREYFIKFAKSFISCIDFYRSHSELDLTSCFHDSPYLNGE